MKKQDERIAPVTDEELLEAQRAILHDRGLESFPELREQIKAERARDDLGAKLILTMFCPHDGAR